MAFFPNGWPPPPRVSGQSMRVNLIAFSSPSIMLLIVSPSEMNMQFATLMLRDE